MMYRPVSPIAATVIAPAHVHPRVSHTTRTLAPAAIASTWRTTATTLAPDRSTVARRRDARRKSDMRR